MDNDRILHVYGPRMYHDDSFIVGTRESLTALRDVIDNALRKGQATGVFSVNDDEGYHLGVIRVEQHTLPELAAPYWEDFAQEKREDAKHPICHGNKAELTTWRMYRPGKDT